MPKKELNISSVVYENQGQNMLTGIFSEKNIFEYCTDIQKHKDFLGGKGYGYWIWKYYLVSELMKNETSKFTRGVVTNDETRNAAINKLKDEVNLTRSILKRKLGEPLWAEQLLAGRQLLVSSAKKLTEITHTFFTNGDIIKAPNSIEIYGSNEQDFITNPGILLSEGATISESIDPVVAAANPPPVVSIPPEEWNSLNV